MNKRWLLLFFVFLLFISFVSAEVSFYDNIVAGYHFTGNSNDVLGNYNLTEQGNMILHEDKDGSANQAYYANNNSSSYFTLTEIPLTLGAISFWAKGNNTDLAIFGDSTEATSSFFTEYAAGGESILFFGTTAYNYFKSGTNHSDNQWHHWVVQWVDNSPGGANADSEVWIDGVNASYSSTNGGAGEWTGIDMIFAGRVSGANRHAKETVIDEFIIMNKTLTESEINELYANYDDWDSITINLTSPKPANDTVFNAQNVNFNLTANATYDFNCSLYINDTLNQTSDNYSSGTDTPVDFDVAFGANEENNYNYIIGCWDGNTDTNTSASTFSIDTVSPTITWVAPATDNSSVHNLFNDTYFTASITASDPNLYSWYYNVSYGGTVLYEYTKTDLTETSFTITNRSELDNYTGVFQHTIQACDGSPSNEVNCITEIKDLFVYNVTTSYEENPFSEQNNYHQLNVTYDSSYITSLSASLTYNGTNYPVTGSVVGGVYVFDRTVIAPAVTTESNVSFYWNYVINGDEFNYTTESHSVFLPDIDNCSTYTTPWINFTLRDELNDTLLVGDVEYVFEYSYGNNGTGTYNNTGSSQSSFEFCMYPSLANFTTDITLQYSVTGYETRDYVKQNYIVDNLTDQITLYALESGESTAITFHVVDGDDEDFEGVFIEAYRYDFDTDTDLLVESETTDSDGNVILNLQVGTNYYSFRFYVGGELRLRTNRFKLFSTSYEYVITDDVTTRLGQWLILNRDVDSTLNYTNTTNLVYFDWSYSGGLADQFCLSVSLLNGTSYHYSCSANTTGSLEYTITVLNQSYVALGQVITTSGFTFNLETLNIDTRDYGHKLGTEFSLMISFIIFLVISLLGLISPTIAIVMAIFALIILSMFGLLPLSVTWLTTIVIFGVIVLVIVNKRRTI